MLRIVTFNANGIRSASSKGFWNWFDGIGADILCVQELKARDEDIPKEISARPGYRSWFHCAEKRGYSGCGVWTRLAPVAVSAGFGDAEFDSEGRCMRVDFPRLTVISAYFPSGTSGDARQAAKYRFLDSFLSYMDAVKKCGREVLVCGDLNIAHKEIDLRNWRSNQDHSGFLPEERAWLTSCLDGHGWVDVFRRMEPGAGQYTWWSFRGRAREKNVGWRIDYEIGTPGVALSARAVSIHRDDVFSDHAPLVIDYDFDPAG